MDQEIINFLNKYNIVYIKIDDPKSLLFIHELLINDVMIVE